MFYDTMMWQIAMDYAMAHMRAEMAYQAAEDQAERNRMEIKRRRDFGVIEVEAREIKDYLALPPFKEPT